MTDRDSSPRGLHEAIDEIDEAFDVEPLSPQGDDSGLGDDGPLDDGGKETDGDVPVANLE